MRSIDLVLLSEVMKLPGSSFTHPFPPKLFEVLIKSINHLKAILGNTQTIFSSFSVDSPSIVS